MFLKVQINDLNEAINKFAGIHDLGIHTTTMAKANRALRRASRHLTRAQRYYEEMSAALHHLKSDPEGREIGRHDIIYRRARVKARGFLQSGIEAVGDCSRLCDIALEQLNHMQLTEEALEMQRGAEGVAEGH
ncbi:hypothetical protein DFH27DRAFT_609691 [Peziza echinospora]|nr:hypothetical protein DFH27DRAFT_609691 [Peziza echinospora]